MSSELKGKVAIVTGASRGIGAAIAESLAAKDAKVVVNYTNSGNIFFQSFFFSFIKESKANSLVETITKNGGKAIAIKADVSKPSEISRLYAETIKQFGGVDIVVNNVNYYFSYLTFNLGSYCKIRINCRKF